MLCSFQRGHHPRSEQFLFHLHNFLLMFILIFKVLPGCDCCVVDGKLVPDGKSWIQGGKVYGK